MEGLSDVKEPKWIFSGKREAAIIINDIAEGERGEKRAAQKVIHNKI